MYQVIMDRLRRFSYKHMLTIWTTTTFLSIANFTWAFIVLNRPDLSNYAGAFATVFSYFFFTRQKQQWDDATRQCQLSAIKQIMFFDEITYHRIEYNEVLSKYQDDVLR